MTNADYIEKVAAEMVGLMREYAALDRRISDWIEEAARNGVSTAELMGAVNRQQAAAIAPTPGQVELSA